MHATARPSACVYGRAHLRLTSSIRRCSHLAGDEILSEMRSRRGSDLVGMMPHSRTHTRTGTLARARDTRAQQAHDRCTGTHTTSTHDSGHTRPRLGTPNSRRTLEPQPLHKPRRHRLPRAVQSSSRSRRAAAPRLAPEAIPTQRGDPDAAVWQHGHAHSTRAEHRPPR